MLCIVALLQVTGPRSPCPKVDAMMRTKGLAHLCRQNGWAGYFVRVLRKGCCQPGDAIYIISRQYPGFTIERVAQGLWGPPDSLNNSLDFLQTLANMDCLIPRHLRDLATNRLARLLDEDN